MSYEIKNIDGGILDVDDSSRRVKVAINKVGVKDFDNDVIEKTAFNKTIKERGPQGKGLIWHLTDHNPSLKSAVARFKEVYMEGDYLVGISDIPNTTWGNDVLELYKTGNINQHSIGFRTIQKEQQKDATAGDYILIKEVMLYEGSAVLWGANEHTPTFTVGKSLTKEEAVSEYAKTLEEVKKISKLFRTGHLSNESFELLDIKMSQLTDRLHQLFILNQETTEPELTTQPDAKDELLSALKQYANNLKANDSGKRINPNP
jgi:HK97 family phage prohead protease